MTTYTNPYTGQTISPSQVGYENLTISANTTLDWPINGNTTNVVANIVEVTATTTGLSLIMPSATAVSTGQSVLIRNLGSNPFTVVENDGLTTIIVINSGIAQYIYLTNNSTPNGTWSTVQFGAGTSAANSSTLQGYGLKAVNTTLNTVSPVVTVSSNYSFTNASQSSLYVWTGGAGTLTLPSASSVPSGWYVIVKNDGTGILNIATVGTDTIDGLGSTQLQLQESLVVVSSGANWYSYAYGQSASFFFTQLTIDLTTLASPYILTLNSSQSVSIIQEYTGTLHGNTTVILPPTVQFYSMQNKTTGPYTLTFTTGVAGGTTVILPQNQTIILICDGTNVYNAQTATSSSFSTISLASGSAASPSLNFTSDSTTGLYLAASGQLGFAISGALGGRITSSGMYLPVGINGGAF